MKDVHRLERLGVRLVDSTTGGVSFNPSSESSLMKLKDSVLIKMNKSFVLGGDGIHRYHERM